jgi:alkanesulfonate monooxygenase SsuD/methylene tetrahydromethanopterin reductase-like flavin-dependent oxidoreductase (luciferase family)
MSSLPSATARTRFGISLPPTATSSAEHVRAAVAADEAGLDLIGVMDHPYHPRYLDTLSLIGMLLGRTERIHIFPDVANLPLRSPEMLAKAAASLDLLSGGRFELGLGSGGYWEAIKTFGVTPLSRAQAVDALEEAVAVIRALWSGDRAVHFNGSYYRLDGATGGPPPPHPIGIWLGAQGARLLATTGRLADGWAAPIPSYLPYERWAAAQTTIDDAARLAGREPTAIRRLAQVVGTISDRPHGRWEPVGAAPIRGDSSQWAEAVTYLVDELRFDTVVFWPEEASVEQIERFADLATHVSERSQPAATRNQQTTTTEGGSHA